MERDQRKSQVSIPALGKWRQKDEDFQVHLCYTRLLRERSRKEAGLAWECQLHLCCPEPSEM